MKNLTVPLILLAAGESKRMGTPKQLLTYRGSSLIRHAATEAAKSNCDPIIVVLGAKSDRISPQINDLPVYIAYNAYWQKGMSTSIATGITSLLEMNIDLDAVIVALADQPFVTSQVYNRLIKSYYQNEVKVVASSYSDTLGVPALFDRTLIPELLKMKQKGGAKQLLNKYSDRASCGRRHEVICEAVSFRSPLGHRAFNLHLPEAAIDIDTPADYQKLLTT